MKNVCCIEIWVRENKLTTRLSDYMRWNKIPTNGRRFVGMVVSSHQIDARGGAEGSGDGRQDGNDEMQDFLYEFFFFHVFYV